VAIRIPSWVWIPSSQCHAIISSSDRNDILTLFGVNGSVTNTIENGMIRGKSLPEAVATALCQNWDGGRRHRRNA
jgi:hypothetical protein